MPTPHGASPGAARRTRIGWAPRSAITCSALVGLTWPKRLALGAATGTAAARSSSRASACAGQRTPTKPEPAVTAGGSSATAGATMVSGPGQNSAASPRISSSPAGPRRTSRSASAAAATCTISGSVRGRPLVAKIRATASSSKACAPSPYTVSVGNATSPPDRSASAASSRLSTYRPRSAAVLISGERARSACSARAAPGPQRRMQQGMSANDDVAAMRRSVDSMDLRGAWRLCGRRVRGGEASARLTQRSATRRARPRGSRRAARRARLAARPPRIMHSTAHQQILSALSQSLPPRAHAATGSRCSAATPRILPIASARAITSSAAISPDLVAPSIESM